MEAPTRSGALITARFANDFGRDVYVLPGSLDNARSLGCLGLLSKGAQVIESENHLLEMLGAMPKLDPVEPSRTVEQLALPNLQQTGMSAGLVSSALLQLELMGMVSQLPGMRYQRC